MRRFAVLLAISGCNQLLDLEPAADRADSIADRDGDGIANARDNCVDVANLDQFDRDGDGVGDACDECADSPPLGDNDADGIDDGCDLCVLGPNVDDDGDGFYDACDVCPATFDDQADTDTDLVGDACDGVADDGTSERFRFLAFDSLDSTWPGASQWRMGSDGSSLEPDGVAMASLTITSGQDVVTGSVEFELPVAGEVGIQLAGDVGCHVRCDEQMCELIPTGADGATVSHPRFARGTIQGKIPPTGNMVFGNLNCELRVPGESAVLFGGEIAQSAAMQEITVFATSGMKVIGADLIR